MKIVHNLKIVNAMTKYLLDKQCGVCNKSILDMYCNHCKETLSEYNYVYKKIQLTLLYITQNKVEIHMINGKVIEALFGCPPTQFMAYLELDPLFREKVEDQLNGMYCSVVFEDKNKISQVILSYPEDIQLTALTRTLHRRTLNNEKDGHCILNTRL
ncbi:hypothetical protein BDB01DRAFT_770146 [Pilobolus umbonatus]|nr:hypothetical protein BDB01DRAFT_770146 [Pilobolus umbonatus]